MSPSWPWVSLHYLLFLFLVVGTENHHHSSWKAICGSEVRDPELKWLEVDAAFASSGCNEWATPVLKRSILRKWHAFWDWLAPRETKAHGVIMPSGVLNMMQSGTVSNMPCSAMKGLWITECSRAVRLRPWEPEKAASASIFSSLQPTVPTAIYWTSSGCQGLCLVLGTWRIRHELSTFSREDSLVVVTGASEQRRDKYFFDLFKAKFLVMRASSRWQGFCKVPFAFSVLDTFSLKDVPSSHALSRNCLKTVGTIFS